MATPVAPPAAGLADAAAPLVCAFCNDTSATARWNNNRIFNQGLPNQHQMPVGDLCYPCAITIKVGQYPWSMPQMREKIAQDPNFREEFLASKMIRDGSTKPTFDMQEVVEQTNFKVVVHTPSKIISPQDFQQSYGVTCEEAGVAQTTVGPDVFGVMRTGVLTEDVDRQTEIFVVQEFSCSLTGFKMQRETQIRQKQGADSYDKAKSMCGRTPYSAAALKTVAEQAIKRAEEAQMESAAAAAEGMTDGGTGTGADAAKRSVVEVGVTFDEEVEEEPEPVPKKKARTAAGGRGRGGGRATNPRGRATACQGSPPRKRHDASDRTVPTPSAASFEGSSPGGVAASPVGAGAASVASDVGEDGCLVHDTAVKLSDVERYMNKLNNVHDVLTGAYSTIGRDIYQANRLLKSKKGMDAVTQAKLQRRINVAICAKELVPERLGQLPLKSLRLNLKAVGAVLRELPAVTVCELWMARLDRAVADEDWGELVSAMEVKPKPGFPQFDPTSAEVSLADVLRIAPPDELPATFTKALLNKVLLCICFLAGKDDDGNRCPRKLATEALRQLCTHLQGGRVDCPSSLVAAWDEVATFCRAMAGLVDPTPGACGHTPEDVDALITLPEKVNLEDPVHLFLDTLNGDDFWSSLISQWQAVLFTEGKVGGHLTQMMEKLQKEGAGAIMESFKELPGFLVNLRAGAADEFQSLVKRTIIDLVNGIRTCEDDDQRTDDIAHWFPMLRDSTQSLPPCDLKTDLRRNVADLADMFDANRTTQATRAVVRAAMVCSEQLATSKIIEDSACRALGDAFQNLNGHIVEASGDKTVLSGMLETAHTILKDASSVSEFPIKTADGMAIFSNKVAAGIDHAKTDFALAETVLKVHMAQSDMEKLGETHEVRMRHDRGEMDKLARVLAGVGDKWEASDEDCAFAECAGTIFSQAKGALVDAVQFLIRGECAKLEQAMTDFTPMAKGGEDGSDWKQGLPDKASLEEVKAHADQTFAAFDALKASKLWRALASRRDALNSAMKKYVPTEPNDECNKLLKDTEDLLKVGQCTLTEGVLLEILVGDTSKKVDNKTTKATATKQFAAMAKLGLSAAVLHPAIYAASQSMLKMS